MNLITFSDILIVLFPFSLLLFVCWCPSSRTNNPWYWLHFYCCDKNTMTKATYGEKRFTLSLPFQKEKSSSLSWEWSNIWEFTSEIGSRKQRANLKREESFETSNPTTEGIYSSKYTPKFPQTANTLGPGIQCSNSGWHLT